MTAISLKGMAPLLQVFDMPASLKFYRDIIGFKVVQSSGEGDDVDWVLLQLNEVELMLNTVYEKECRPSVPESARVEAHSDTSLYFGCPDVDQAYQYLLHHHCKVDKPIITGYGWKALYVKDPDGYTICMHWPTDKTGESL